MIKVLFPLASANLRKNYRLYGPFALAFISSTALLYNFISLVLNEQLPDIRGGESIITVLTLGLIIMVMTMTIIIWYANSFVFRQRTKEYGLYGILGLERRHLLQLMTIELTLFALLCSVLGLVFGLAFNHLLVALYQRLMQLQYTLPLSFNMRFVELTLQIVGVLYLSLIIINSWRIYHLKPLQLVRESRRGEKASCFTWLYALLGIVLTAGGYYLAITITNPITAIFIFFIAVLLVSAGTYCLFQAGSILLLKFLQGRKSYYYQAENFISISNLIFRMRKNGIGLATICLLSSMSLVTLSAGISLYLGTETTINRMYPHDFSLMVNYLSTIPDQDPTDQLKASLNQLGQDYQLELGTLQSTNYLRVYGHHEQGQFVPTVRLQNSSPGESMGVPNAVLTIMTSAEYQQLTGHELNLEAGQALWYSQSLKAEKEVDILGQHFQLVTSPQENPLTNLSADYVDMATTNQSLLVVHDLSPFKDALENTAYSYRSSVTADSQASHSQQLSAGEGKDAVLTTISHVISPEDTPLDSRLSAYATLNIKADIRDGYLQMIGSIFFIGIFLASLFLLGLSLTIYYKQISEGLEDAKQFDILKKVGLSHDAINRTIRRQILVVFFAPILLALCHLAGAFHMMSLIILVISAVPVHDIILPTIGTALAISLFYFLVFLITSRSYRKIIAAKH